MKILKSKENLIKGDIKVADYRYHDISDGYSEYFIGKSSILRNPFYLKDVRDLIERKEKMKTYKIYLWREYNRPGSKIKSELHSLARRVMNGEKIKFLSYFSSPCHGDILRDCIYWIIKTNQLEEVGP